MGRDPSKALIENFIALFQRLSAVPRAESCPLIVGDERAHTLNADFEQIPAARRES